MHKYWINYQTLPFTRYEFNTSKKFLTTIFYSPPPFLSLLRPAITSLVRVCTLLDWSKLSNVSACLVFSNSPTPHHHPHSPIPLTVSESYIHNPHNLVLFSFSGASIVFHINDPSHTLSPCPISRSLPPIPHCSFYIISSNGRSAPLFTVLLLRGWSVTPCVVQKSILLFFSPLDVDNQCGCTPLQLYCAL